MFLSSTSLACVTVTIYQDGLELTEPLLYEADWFPVVVGPFHRACHKVYPAWGEEVTELP